jgi:hypothetical protein
MQFFRMDVFFSAILNREIGFSMDCYEVTPSFLRCSMI